jgi:hypothetical protein
MGHANIETTMRYLHFTPRPEDARLVAEAFETAQSIGARELTAQTDIDV